MKCEIIRDLLPGYIDGLTSETSNAAIEEHLKECEECRKYLEVMKKEIVSEQYIERSKEEIKEDIKPFRKIKKEMRKKTITAVVIVLITVAVLATILESLYGHGTSAGVDDVQITYEKVNGVVTLGFLSTDDSQYIEVFGGDWVLDENGKEIYEWNKIMPVKWRIKPFRDSIRYDDEWRCVFIDEDTILDQNGEILELTGNEVLEIEFAGETKKVKMTDLYTGKVIKDLQ